MAFRTLRDDRLRHPGERGALERRSRLSRVIFSKLNGFFNSFVTIIVKVHLPPQVQIGKDFHIVHASGTLAVHPDVVIGDRCGIMHNVTIGVNMGPGVPRIGDDVFIGTGAVILGDIEIGDRVRIGANAVVTSDVPADSIVNSPQSRDFPVSRCWPRRPRARRGHLSRRGRHCEFADDDVLPTPVRQPGRAPGQDRACRSRPRGRLHEPGGGG